MDDQTKRLGFLAMMTNPDGANKPPPAFLTKKDEESDQVPQDKALEMTSNAQLDKPIMKRKKRRGKNPAAAFGAPASDPKPEPVVEAAPVLPQIDPPKQEPEKPKLPELPKVEEKKAEPSKPVAKPKVNKGFLDDSDDDDDDDFFAKKSPAKAAEPGNLIKYINLILQYRLATCTKNDDEEASFYVRFR